MSTSNANARRLKPHSHTPPPVLEDAFESCLGSHPDHAQAWPATRSTSVQPTEASDTTILGAYYHSGTLENTSSVTFQDEFPWHEVGANKHTQRVPSTIVPALLQCVSDVCPPRSPLDDAVDENSSLDDLPKYSTTQKGKWKAQTDDSTVHGSWIGTESLQFDFPDVENSAEEWAVHSRPILQEYADRQTSLPLGRRLEVSIDAPSQFILGALHLLVNRDQPGCTDHSRKLGPQLIENFVDIDRWAKEYFRSRHATQFVDNDVSTLLTIVLNHFYEGQVQLIDRLVEFALENMRVCGRRNLGVEDFAFGFDFRMSQDLPFYVETCSRVREPFPIPTVEVNSTVESVTTSSGRQVKPTKRALESVQQAQENQSEEQGKKKDTLQVKPTTCSVLAFSQPEASPSQPSSNEKVLKGPPASFKAAPVHTKHRPIQPSNLRLPPVMPGSSTPRTVQRSDDSAESKLPAGLGKSEVVSGSNAMQRSPPRLKFRLLPMSTKGPAANDSSLTPSAPDRTSAIASAAPAQERVARRSERTRPGGPRNLGRGRGRGRDRAAGVVAPAKILEATSANAAKTPPTASTAEGTASPVPNKAVHGGQKINAAKGKSLAGTSNAGSGGAVDNTRSVLSQFDPGHPRRRKRRLGDCDE